MLLKEYADLRGAASDYSNRDMIPRTWHVTHRQAAEIAMIANGLGVHHSRLVRYLLAFALAELDAGRLELRTRPVRWELIDEF